MSFAVTHLAYLAPRMDHLKKKHSLYEKTLFSNNLKMKRIILMVRKQYTGSENCYCPLHWWPVQEEPLKLWASGRKTAFYI